MNLRGIAANASSHLRSNDVVALFQVAALLGPLLLSLVGVVTPLPLSLPAGTLFVLLAGAMVAIYFSGVKSRNDMSRARLGWMLAVVLPLAFPFGWLVDLRADPFFTRESLWQVSAVLLGLCILAGVMERSAARGTPSDVLATSTSSIGLICLILFWVSTALNVHAAAAVFLLLGGILVALTVLLRLPGAVVPIYAARRRRRGKREDR